MPNKAPLVKKNKSSRSREETYYSDKEEEGLSTESTYLNVSNRLYVCMNWFRGKRYLHVMHRFDKLKKISLAYPKDLDRLRGLDKYYEELEKDHYRSKDTCRDKRKLYEDSDSDEDIELSLPVEPTPPKKRKPSKEDDQE